MNRYEDEINKRASVENEFVLLKKVSMRNGAKNPPVISFCSVKTKLHALVYNVVNNSLSRMLMAHT